MVIKGKQENSFDFIKRNNRSKIKIVKNRYFWYDNIYTQIKQGNTNGSQQYYSSTSSIFLPIRSEDRPDISKTDVGTRQAINNSTL